MRMRGGKRMKVPVILVKDHRQFHGRLVESEIRCSFGDSGRMDDRTPGSVPFHWETEPGKPKVSRVAEGVPELNLPPMLRSSAKFPTALVRQPPSRSASQKMISLLNGKFSGSGRLSTGGNRLSTRDTPRLGSLRLPFKKYALGRSDCIESNQSCNFGPKINSCRHAERMQSDTILTVNDSSKPLNDINSRNACDSDLGSSPRSTLEYTCDRSAYSSPFHCRSMDSSMSFSQQDSSITPGRSLSQDSSGATCSSTSTATAARTILANWFRSLGTNSEPDFVNPTTPDSTITSEVIASEVLSRVTMNKSRSGPQPPYCLTNKCNQSHSGPQLSTSRSKRTTQSRMFSRQPKFFSQPQEISADQFPTNVSSGKKLAVQNPTCSDLDLLFPLKSVQSSFLKQMQQNISLQESGIQSTFANLSSNNSGHKDVNVEAETDEDDSKLFTFSPVASAFLFTDSDLVSETTSFNRRFTRDSSTRTDPTTDTYIDNLSSPEIISLPLIEVPHSELGKQSSATSRDPQEKAQAESISNCRSSLISNPEIFTEVHGSSSSELVNGSDSTRGAAQRPSVLARSTTGSLSSHRISPKDLIAVKQLHDVPEFRQDHVMTVAGPSKISGVLLRQVRQVEEDFHRQNSLSKHAIMMIPTCLPALCSAFGRSVGRRFKGQNQRDLLEYDL